MRLTPTQARLVTKFPGGVAAVPSRHGSLPFADAAARALCLGADCLGTPFRRVFLELPGDLETAPAILAERLPTCGAIIIIYPGADPAAILPGPIYDSEGRVFAREGEEVLQGGILPCTPTDSLAVASRVGAKHNPRRGRPELVCGDVSSRFRLGMDEDSIKRKPLPSEWDPSRFQMGKISLDQFWQSGKWNPNTKYDSLRDSHMAWGISQIPDRREETLVIIGAAHERGIRKHLAKGTGSPVQPTRTKGYGAAPRLEFIPLPPSLMHNIGWMEMPCLAEKFAAYLGGMTPQSAAEGGFDYRTALDGMIADAIRHHGRMSPRSCDTFRRMISEILTLKGSWMVESIEELSSLGEACVSRKFGAALREVAEQSSPLIDGTDPDQPRAIFIGAFGGLLCRLSDGSLCLVRLPLEDSDSPSASRGRKGSISREHSGQFGLSEKQRKEVGGLFSGLPARAEHLHRKEVNIRARSVAHRLLHEEERRRSRAWTSAPYEGGLGMGIDVRGMVRERARGNPAPLRIRKRKRREPDSAPPCHNFCPLVYVFDPDVTGPGGTQTGSYIFDHYSVTVAAYWYKGATKRPHPGILLREMSVYANLFCTEAPEYNQRECREWIEKHIPPEYVCKRSPESDPDLAPFRGNAISLALAWAIRYSRHHCVVVSESHLAIPPGVRDFAAERGVQILPVSAGAIGEEHFDRMRWDTQVPGGANVWDGPKEWTDRFTFPIPGQGG